MAGEIVIQMSVDVANGNLLVRIPMQRLSIDQTTARGGLPGMQVIGTSHESVAVGDLVSPGWVWLKNLDETNYVQFGVDVSSTFYPLGKLKPGESAVWRLEPSATLYLRADTAACACQIIVLDD